MEIGPLAKVIVQIKVVCFLRDRVQLWLRRRLSH